jgi:hypothetical protein
MPTWCNFENPNFGYPMNISSYWSSDVTDIGYFRSSHQYDTKPVSNLGAPDSMLPSNVSNFGPPSGQYDTKTVSNFYAGPPVGVPTHEIQGQLPAVHHQYLASPTGAPSAYSNWFHNSWDSAALVSAANDCTGMPLDNKVAGMACVTGYEASEEGFGRMYNGKRPKYHSEQATMPQRWKVFDSTGVTSDIPRSSAPGVAAVDRVTSDTGTPGQTNFRHIEVMNKDTLRKTLSSMFGPADASHNMDSSSSSPGLYKAPSNNWWEATLRDIPHDTKDSGEILCGPLDMYRSTITVRNVPWSYSQALLLQEWGDEAFDFLFLPMADQRPGNLGRVFINFPDPENIAKFFHRWNGRKLTLPGKKPIKVLFANIQGRDENIRHILCESQELLKRPTQQPEIREWGRKVSFNEYVAKQRFLDNLNCDCVKHRLAHTLNWDFMFE